MSDPQPLLGLLLPASQADGTTLADALAQVAPVIAPLADGGHEIVRDGLQLIAGPSRLLPADDPVRQWPRSFVSHLPSELAVIWLAPGPHLAAGRALPPVWQAILGVGCGLSPLLGALAFAWAPARQVTGADAFVEQVGTHLAGGAFPVLALVGIDRDRSARFRTRGLAFFCGQEVQLAAPPAIDDAGCVRRLARLVHDLATNGPVGQGGTAVRGLDPGETLRLETSADDQLVTAAVLPAA